MGMGGNLLRRKTTVIVSSYASFRSNSGRNPSIPAILFAIAFAAAIPGAAAAQGHDPELGSPVQVNQQTETLPVPVTQAAEIQNLPIQAENIQDSAPTLGTSSEPDQASADLLPSLSPEVPASSSTNENAGPVAPDLIISGNILVDGLQFDLPMPWGHEEFESIRAAYLTNGGKKWLKVVMERALPFLSYIESRVIAWGLPWELVYLPVIESEYSPYAVSRSGATGLWQFMRNSISGYGLKISDWKDDRRDFMKSTDAALLKLKDNYQALGDWLLAIAAYNAGLGAVSRAVKTSDGQTIDFWHLYDSRKLSREPLSYVPKLLAIASILRYPELHGLPAEWGERMDWQTFETNRQVDMNVLASKTGIPAETLKLGNAELTYHITPPGSSHVIKVPSDKADAVKAILEDTSTPLYKYEIYKVKSGDTLSGIAQRYGASISIIKDANPGLNPDKIKIGQTVIIPFIGSGKASVGGSAASSAPSAASGSSFPGIYTVKKGDTLWDISLLYNIQPETLARENGLSLTSVLKIGQKLRVPAR